MEDTFTLDQMMVPSTDTQEAFTLEEMNAIDKEPDFYQPKQLGYFESIAEAFMRGDRSWQTDKLGYEALQKGSQFYNSTVRPVEDKFYEDMKSKRMAEGGWLKNAGISLAEMMPGLVHGAAGGVVGGSVAGLGTVAVGSLLPLPEEAFTVPAAFGAGFTVGSAKEWYEQGAGNLYNTMAREGVPDEIAQPTAHIAGAMYSAIEFMQFHKYIPGGKEASKKLIASTVQNTIKNVVKKYGVNWAENVFEEGLQEIVNESAKEYARAVSGKSDTATGDKIMNVMTKGWEAMKSSALPMLLLLAPAMGKAAIDVSSKTGGTNAQEARTETLPTSQEKASVEGADGGVRLRDVTEGGVETKPGEVTPIAPKMVEKEFIEEYEEVPESLEKEYARAHKERTEQLATMLSINPQQAGSKRKGRGFELSATLRQYRGEPTLKEIKAETKKLNAMTVGKIVETSKGEGVVTKNPAYGRVQVEVKGVKEAFLMEDVAPINTTKEQAIASLKAKAEKSMAKYLKDIGREYKPTSIKRTRVVKRMVPAEQVEKKPVDVVEIAPEFVERTDDQIRAEALSSYLGSTEDSAGMQIVNDDGEVLGKMRSSRPAWWSSLGISMERTTDVLDKYSKGQEMTDTEKRDLKNIMEAGKSTAASMVSPEEIATIKKTERLIASGATQEEAVGMVESEEAQDMMDAAGIVDDETWVADLPVETAPALETPKGERKVSKSAADVARRMVEAGFSELSDIEQAGYSANKKKEKLDALATLMEDYERAKRIAFAEEDADPIDAQIIFNAVETRAMAEGDMDTLSQLAESPVASALSKAAQVMRAAGYNKASKEYSPVAAMQEIAAIRKTEVAKKVDVAKETSAEVKSIKDMTKKELKKMDWDGFVKSIEC